MAQDTQELRQDIERIRDELDETLDALGERVSPRRIAQRRKDAMRSRVAQVRTTVMGSAQETGSATTEKARHAKDAVQGTASQVAERVGQAPDLIQHQTQGNPLAAGLVAFGVGILVATMFTPTHPEHPPARPEHAGLDVGAPGVLGRLRDRDPGDALDSIATQEIDRCIAQAQRLQAS